MYNVREAMVTALSIIAVVMVVVVGSVHAEGEVGRGKEGVMAYWGERVKGARMPSMLQRMVTPLSAQQVEALRDPNFLPAHAPAFCQAARLLCTLPSFFRTLVANDKIRYHRPSASSPAQRPQHGGFFRQSLALVAGAKIKVHDEAMEATQERAFLPRELANLFPINGQKAIPKMVRMLGIPKSAIPSMENNVADCSQNIGLPGEVKACFSSIEALADFASSIMASSQPITVLDAVSPLPPYSAPNTVHTVLVVKDIQQDPNSKYLACHDVFFPFRLFYCHYIDQTRLFLATLQAQDGSMYNRVATCHYDTSAWDPSHVSFSDTHTKPGESEACHWMGKGSIVFLHKDSS